MKSDLKFRMLAIVAVILICIYGIIGLPKSTQELVDNWKKNIHLGLDLKGGSHLVLTNAFPGSGINADDTDGIDRNVSGNAPVFTGGGAGINLKRRDEPGN